MVQGIINQQCSSACAQLNVVFSLCGHVLNKSISVKLCQFNPQTISSIILITVAKIITGVVVVFNSGECWT